MVNTLHATLSFRQRRRLHQLGRDLAPSPAGRIA